MEEFKRTARAILSFIKRNAYPLLLAGFAAAAASLTSSCASHHTGNTYSSNGRYYYDGTVFEGGSGGGGGLRGRWPKVNYSVSSGRADFNTHYYPGSNRGIVRDPFRLRK